MELSIIILNYDTLALVKQCLDSISRYPPDIDFEIILVNNGSRRDRPEDLVPLHPRVVVLDLPMNVGFGRANNLATKQAQGRYILLLNSDTYFLDDSLQKAMNYARANPETDVFGCRIFFPDLTPQKAAFELGPSNRALGVFQTLLEKNALMEKFRQYSPRRSFTHAPEQAYGLFGSYILIKRAVYRASRGFDPDFYLYAEEVEWFYNRLQRYSVDICQEARIVHLGGGSHNNDFWRLQPAISDFLFYYKLGRASYLIAVLTFFSNILTRICCLPFASHFWKQNLSILRSELSMIPYLLFDIPRYPRAYGSRPEPLMIREYKTCQKFTES